MHNVIITVHNYYVLYRRRDIAAPRQSAFDHRKSALANPDLPTVVHIATWHIIETCHVCKYLCLGNWGFEDAVSAQSVLQAARKLLRSINSTHILTQWDKRLNLTDVVMLALTAVM